MPPVCARRRGTADRMIDPRYGTNIRDWSSTTTKAAWSTSASALSRPAAEDTQEDALSGDQA